jgi:hypothetical protein
LRHLDAAHLIQSADYILEQAAQSDRNVEQQRQVRTDTDTRTGFVISFSAKTTTRRRNNRPLLGSPLLHSIATRRYRA